MEIYHHFYFEAARKLPKLPASHPCARVHGHSFRVTVYLAGKIDSNGWVMDYADLQKAVSPYVAMLDHHYLNDIEGLANPTTENIAQWLWDKLAPSLKQLAALELKETKDCGCIIRRQ